MSVHSAAENNAYGDHATMIYRPLFLTALIALLLLGNRIYAQVAEQSRGGQILSGYKQDLQHALRSGMSEGVVEAIKVCRVQAPKIAQNWSQDEIRVGRASHRLRNPNNTAPAWVEPILNAYVANAADRKPRNVLLSAGRSGYVEPIILQPLCTACHGETISNEVAAQISKLYPADRAVGFGVGDLRGVFWVEYPAVK